MKKYFLIRDNNKNIAVANITANHTLSDGRFINDRLFFAISIHKP